MMKKVIEATRGVYEKHNKLGDQVSLSLMWICKLECGHEERRIRSMAPDKLKCFECREE